ncbi:hypothetical protein TanjilG_30997 [Lupinus angustifolius]|uniref:Phytocyanin domain-containing protein n=1 Tax=Lupinus angustifolius TaxID=3871 RepID=A0A1J7HMH7_LUPAN|nr:PREDICTED: uclacyanin-3-like [Lupinus angustifolius]OIW03577.1 hypothetical protein TanjilG_30997 [Lupinus angustifolius]
MEELKLAWTVKTIIAILFTSTLFRCVCGANISVGGVSGWDLTSNIQLWSSTATFHVGDDLVFIYTPVYDVIEVNQEGYDTCTIANAIATYETGETVISLNEPGTRYFVCGRLGHCQLGLKLEVQILAQSNNNTDDDDSNNNNDDDDPERRRGGRSPSPPRPISPPPPPRHRPPHPPPPPGDVDLPQPPPPNEFDFPQPPPNPSLGPCQCSRAAENNYGVMMTPLMITQTLVILLLGFYYLML